MESKKSKKKIVMIPEGRIRLNLSAFLNSSIVYNSKNAYFFSFSNSFRFRNFNRISYGANYATFTVACS
mgnify:CR=1